MPAGRQPPARDPDDPWLPLGAASRLVGVGPDTLRRWADTGKVQWRALQEAERLGHKWPVRYNVK